MKRRYSQRCTADALTWEMDGGTKKDYLRCPYTDCRELAVDPDKDICEACGREGPIKTKEASGGKMLVGGIVAIVCAFIAALTGVAPGMLVLVGVFLLWLVLVG